METALRFLLANLPLLLFIVALVRTLLRIRYGRIAHRVISPAYVLWGETLFWSVGIGFIVFGVMHAYFQGFAAPPIGWKPSPFEYELGWFEIGLGVVALLAWWRGYEFRLAATLIFAIFSLAAAVQHVDEIVRLHNYAPGNAGITLWFGDIFLPLLLLVLAYLSSDAHERSP